MDLGSHPAVAAIRGFIEPWRSDIAEIREQPYKEVYPDDYSLDNDPEDVVIKIRPKNDNAAPLELLAYSGQTDRVDIELDRWSHLASLVGAEHPLGKRGVDYYVAGVGDFVTLAFAEQVIQAAAQGDIVVKVAIIGRRMRGTSAVVQLPTGRNLKRGINGILGARLLSFVGLAEIKTYRYAPWGK